MSSFTPTIGLPGVVVTIAGSNFTGTTGVDFNGTPAVSFTVDSSAQVRATVPAGATTGPISVTNPAGTGTSTGNFFAGAAPVMSSFSPVAGLPGTAVTLTGSHFTGVTSVWFNSASASFSVDNDGQISTTVPVGATTGLIAVANPVGIDSSATVFFVGAAPVVTSFTPTSGLAGAIITIAGSNFDGTSGVSFNGSPAVSFTVDSSVQVHATVPGGATTGPIAVKNPAGTGTSASSFFVGSAPAVASFTPTSGVVGAVITIAGSNFDGTTGVSFNGTAATFTVTNDGQIATTVPVGATTGPVSVTNPAGTGASGTKFFVGSVPAIFTFSPGAGPSGTVVTISGSHFTGATGVSFNGTPASSFTVDFNSQLHATVPAGATTGPVLVTNPAGTGTSPSNFFLPPTIAGFTPTSGPVGRVVTITGTNLVGTTQVRFNGLAASAFGVQTNTQMTAAVPTGATTGPISLTAPGGVATSAANFTVVPGPGITSISPTSGPVGSLVNINGAGFVNVQEVRFGEFTVASFTVESSTLLKATVPPGARAGTIRVTTDAGSTTSSQTFTVTVPPGSPTITGFTPTSGAMGTVVTITGTGFVGATGAWFGGKSATYTVVNSTTVQATVPVDAPLGLVSVAVRNIFGTGSSLTNFNVLAVSGEPERSVTALSLSAPWPNPTTGGVSLELALPLPARISVSVYSVTGSRVRVLAEGEAGAGRRQLTWDGRDENGHPVAPGIYFIRLEAGEQQILRRVMRVQ